MKTTRKKGSSVRDAEHHLAFAPKRGKLAPRGRPFAKGNKIGNRFKPGESGNPSGGPKFKKVSEALRRLLELDVSEPIPMRTNAERLALEMFKMACKKKLGALAEVCDRTEGRAPIAISVEDQNNDPLSQLVIFMKEESQRLGPPEGNGRRRIETAETEEQQQ
jgi:hypothetical protein